MKQDLIEALELMNDLLEDFSVSKNIKRVITDGIRVLNCDEDLAIKCDKVIQSLTVNEDPNIDMFTRTRILSLLSILESACRE